ncbi:hypothetical protein GCM10010510_61570 [Streptomyces anandii JCM 4720]|nr:hypothetical protein GCM10010510_61570 [Streptomyces anandii JCM 4720]
MSTLGPAATGVSSTAPTGARLACGTEQLRWRLTLLTVKPSKEPTALLSATNTGATPCAFDGYPDLEVHLGKGPAVDAQPKTTTRVRLLLGHGRTVEIPLFYPAVRLRDGYCAIPPGEDPEISARPPHPASTDYGASVQMSDPQGRQIRATVCDTIHMGSPRLRPVA